MASPDIESIRQLIMETAGGAPEVAGSAIGLRLKDAFNDELDIKAEYGGLGAFIRRHCSDQIVWIRKRGGDDIYACKGSEAASAEASPRSGDTPWQALTHPNSHSDLALDSGSGTFRVVAAGSQMPEGFVLVEHVSRDEHREIARRFLEELGSELREALEPLLEREDYWSNWLRAMSEQGLETTWREWRRRRLDDLVRLRLGAAGLTEEASRRALEAIKRASRPDPVVRLAPGRKEQPGEEQGGSRLRQLAHRLVDGMCADDLRRLWVPLGALRDSLD